MAIAVGDKVSGKVSGITNFGAFVDLDDDKTGLVHISQISDSYVKDVHDVLSVGDTVNVKVMKIGDDGKIALSMKALEDEKRGDDNNQEHGRDNHHRDYHRNNDYRHGEHHGGFGGRRNGGYRGHGNHRGHENFDAMLAGYMKESESRLSTLKRQTDGKRGGRGGRRS